jgi:hypothetical protein
VRLRLVVIDSRQPLRAIVRRRLTIRSSAELHRAAFNARLSRLYAAAMDRRRLNHIGPIGRTVTDVALQQMAGFDERESASVRAPAADYLKALRRPVRFPARWLAAEVLF